MQEENKTVEQKPVKPSEYRQGWRDGLQKLKETVMPSLDLETSEWLDQKIKEVMG